MDPLISVCCLLQKLKLQSQTSAMAELYSAQGKKKETKNPKLNKRNPCAHMLFSNTGAHKGQQRLMA